MRIAITGICGFVGAVLARELKKYREQVSLVGIDNLSRAGSETNLESLRKEGIDARIGDIRNRDDLEQMGSVDWLIDAAANPSVLAGVDGKTSSVELLDHNLFGTVPVLEFCRAHGATFTLLSTSRVYSIDGLRALPLDMKENAFRYSGGDSIPFVSERGITESFSTTPPLSLYGVSKLCSEQLALEYGRLYQFPVWINRCGVMAGGGQFGTAEQGIFSYWIRAWMAGQPLKYLGFGGHGYQVRDCLHPKDMIPLLLAQFDCSSDSLCPRVLNLSGGARSAMSLVQLSEFCSQQIRLYQPIHDGQERMFDIPWVVLDSALAEKTWNWRPQTDVFEILHEIVNQSKRSLPSDER